MRWLISCGDASSKSTCADDLGSDCALHYSVDVRECDTLEVEEHFLQNQQCLQSTVWVSNEALLLPVAIPSIGSNTRTVTAC